MCHLLLGARCLLVPNAIQTMTNYPLRTGISTFWLVIVRFQHCGHRYCRRPLMRRLLTSGQDGLVHQLLKTTMGFGTSHPLPKAGRTAGSSG
jgi:hypothetical protein